MNPDANETVMAVEILQWLLQLAKYHPVQFSVLFAIMSISGIVGAASLLMEPLALVHNYLEASYRAACRPRGRKEVIPPPPSKLRKMLAFLVKVLSVLSRNTA